MEYSLSALTSVADCDALLNLTQKEVDDLAFRKTSLERQQKKYAETTVEVESEIKLVQAELDAVNMVLAGLPEGETKLDNVKKQKRFEYSLFLLNTRKSSYGAITLLEKELNVARITKELEEAAAFVTAVQSRKAEL
jgi:predicted transcriptional regulator